MQKKEIQGSREEIARHAQGFDLFDDFVEPFWGLQGLVELLARWKEEEMIPITSGELRGLIEAFARQVECLGKTVTALSEGLLTIQKPIEEKGRKWL